MSARETAERVVEEYREIASVAPSIRYGTLKDAITAAILAERNRCARIATDYGRDVPAGRMYADRIAGLIDARP